MTDLITKEEPAIQMQELIDRINELTSSTQQRNTEAFRNLYPAIQQAWKRKVPRKRILELLNASGMKISMGGYLALLKAEEKRREESGEILCCETCGAALPSMSVVNV